MEEKVEVKLGLEGVYFAKSRICKVDGIEGKLYYFGYSIEELAEKSNFEEVCYLLLNGQLPNHEEMIIFSKKMKDKRELDDKVVSLIEELVKTAHPMHILSTAMDLVGSIINDDSTKERGMDRSMDIISKISCITAAIGSISKNGIYIKPDKSLNHVENFLYMLTGLKPDSKTARLMDIMFILHAEHGSNASTFSSIVTASTQSDMYSAIVSGINTLKGPLHGGADERALQMLYDIGEMKVSDYIAKLLAENRRIMGFGHRIYKTYDPRARIIRSKLKMIREDPENQIQSLTKKAFEVEKEVLERMNLRKIYPNVDFFTGLVYRYMDIPITLFTPIFALSRSPGWCSHVLEYWKDNRLIRPVVQYIGDIDLEYKNMDDR